MSKISLAPAVAGTGIFTIASPGTNTNRTLTLPDDTGTIVTNSGNQAGSFTTLNTSGQVVFNDAGANVDFRVEGDTEPNLFFVDASADNIGMGTNSITTFGTAYRTLQLQASSGTGDGSAIRFMYDGGTADTNDLVVYNNSSGGNIRQNGALTLNFLVNGSERARITSNGYFKASDNGTYLDATGPYHEFTNTTANFTIRGINTNVTDPGGIRLDYTGASPNNTASSFLFCADTTALRAEIRSNGGLANFSANNVNLSDARVKKDVADLGSQWNCLKEWNLVEFRYNEQSDDAPKNYGVIAQQIQEHCPEVVQIFQEAKDAVEAKEAVLDEEGNVVEHAVEAQPAQEERIGVREQQMLWMAVKALQEAIERIETLEAKVAALEAK